MDWQQAQKELIAKLTPLYGEREAAIITDWTLENLSGWRKIDRLMHRSDPLPSETQAKLDLYTAELLAHRPVQYVLQESWFCGMKFYVDENVLIPRPETEELVEWIVSDGTATSPSTILDVGTGSGCIAISLAKKLPFAKVHACDSSAGALQVASQNAQSNKTQIQFHEFNFLDPQNWSTLPEITCLVSNPPYIPQLERKTMSTHVIEYEPAQALFVPNDDALIFYRALSTFAKQHLPANAPVYVEIHEDLGPQVVSLFKEAGLNNPILKQDLQGKNRMVKATT